MMTGLGTVQVRIERIIDVLEVYKGAILGCWVGINVYAIFTTAVHFLAVRSRRVRSCLARGIARAGSTMLRVLGSPLRALPHRRR
jgi:hypothetical protein